MKILFGVLMSLLSCIALANAADVKVDNQDVMADKIVSISHVKVGGQTIQLVKTDRVNAEGKHVVCQQYVKLSRPTTTDRPQINVVEFCG